MNKFFALAALAATASFGSADTLTGYLSLNNVNSNEEFGNALNVSATFNMDTVFAADYSNYVLTGIGWDVTLFADSPSWLEEMAVRFDNTTLSDGIQLRPGVGDDFSGTASYSSNGIVDLVGLGLDVSLGNDDSLYVEFFETFNDFANDWDGVWRSGTITLQFEADPVPEPATMAALGLGLAAIARRRRAK